MSPFPIEKGFFKIVLIRVKLICHFAVDITDIKHEGRSTMQSNGMKSLVRRMLLGFLPLLLVLSTTSSSAINLSVQAGFGQSTQAGSYYRTGSWLPLTVNLVGEGISGSAQIQVVVNQDGILSTYSRPAPVHEGTLNESVHFCIDATPEMNMNFMSMMGRGGGQSTGIITVRLVQNGRSLAETAVALPRALSDDSYNVLCITRAGGGFSFLNTKHLGLSHRDVVSQGYNNGFQQNQQALPLR